MAGPGSSPRTRHVLAALALLCAVAPFSPFSPPLLAAQPQAAQPLPAQPPVAQRRSPDAPSPVPALRFATAALRLDGRLDEADWARADSITDFTQRDPAEGQPGTERTVVRFLAAREGLWIGVWAYEEHADRVKRAQLRRDADLSGDDHVRIMLSPMQDKRSGFLFGVNPNGAMADAEILNFENENPNWDGVWDARTRIDSTGWFAEVFIPWQTLRYRPGATTWDVNISRLVRHRNEEVLWRSWRRPEGIRFLETTGSVTGFRDLPGRAVAEVRPYLAGTATADERAFAPSGADSILTGARSELSVGLDAKFAPTPALTLDLTMNADFAQAEVDRQVVNFSRFPLFFPERRPFFTEGAGIFDFGRVRQTQLFYSRRIGLGANGLPVPLVGGARLTGRIGGHQVGFLAVRTGGADPATDLVVRVKKDVLGRGYVGLLATLQDTKLARPTPALGVDFNFPYIIGGQNLVILGGGAAQRDSLNGDTKGTARLVVDYPNDNADIVARFDHVAPGYNPSLGFTEQSGINRFAGQIELTPRPERWGIRKLLLLVLDWDVVTNVDGSLNRLSLETSPLGARWESGDEASVKLMHEEDRPQATFDLFPGTDIAPGRYAWNRAELNVSTASHRQYALSIHASAGDYYDGGGTTVTSTLRARFEPHVLMSAEWERVNFYRGSTGFAATTMRLRLDYAATPQLATTLFAQWNNESDRLAINARLRWTRTPGSDLYVVWNSAWPTMLPGGVPWRRPAGGALVVKYVQYLRY